MQELIAQVRALAEAQKCGALFEKLTRIETGVYVPTRFYFDFPALLAHLQAQQAVVDAAREYRQVERDIRVGSAGMLNAKLAMHALDAALSRIAALTGEEK